MAKISFIGFVDDWSKDNPNHPDWGIKVSEAHYKKDGDEFVVVGRTYRTVKSAWDTKIDFSQFKSGDKVMIEGLEVTEVTEKDGQTYRNLTVKAEVVTLVSQAKKDAEAYDWGSTVKPVADVEAPF